MQTQCGICGKIEDSGIALLGSQNNKFICNSCGAVHYGAPEKKHVYDQPSCAKCRNGSFHLEPIGEYEKLQEGLKNCKECSELLDKCKEGDVTLLVETIAGKQNSRTGRMWGIKTEVVNRIFGEQKSPVILIEQGVAEKIGIIGKEQK